MLKNKPNPALIVTISSIGGAMAIVPPPTYGIGKEGKDRMTVEFDAEFKKRKESIYAISLWPGPVATEAMMERYNKGELDEMGLNIFKNSESTQFPGRVLVKLLSKLHKPKYMQKVSGKCLSTGDLGKEFKVKDVDGRTILPMLSIKNMAILANSGAAGWIPAWLKLPQ